MVSAVMSSGNETQVKLALESLCPVGEVMSVEWKGNKYPTVFRGARGNVYVLSELASGGGKPQIQLAEQGYFFIDIPVVNGKQMLFEFNTSLVVRFLADGVVYGFKTFFLRVHPKAGIIVLEYPNSIERYPLRKHRRVSMLIPASLAMPEANGEVPAAIMDISSSGAKVLLSAEAGCVAGSTVSLTCTLPDGTGVRALAAEVRSVRREGGKLHVGLNFNTTGAAVQNPVGRFYDKCLVYL